MLTRRHLTALALLCSLCAAGAAAGQTAPELLARAYSEAGKLRDPAQRAVALAEIAVARKARADEAWEKTLLEAAEAAQQPEDQLARALACRGVALRAWTCAPPLARQLLDKALVLARGLPYAAQKALALREIARGVTELDPATAAAAFAEAEAAAAKIDSPLFRSAALRDLGAALPAAQTQQATKLFAASAAALASIAPPDEPVQLARIELVVTLCTRDLPAALAEAALIPEEQLRQVCYRRMCEALSGTNVEEAMQVAAKLQEPGQRALGMAALAGQLVITQAETAAAMARSALRMQQNLGPEDLAQLQCAVAVTLSQIDLQEGLDLAHQIQDEMFAGRAVAAIALSLSAKDAVKAAEVAATVEAWDLREEAQGQVALALARADAPAALKLVEGLLSRRDKIHALVALAEAIPAAN